MATTSLGFLEVNHLDLFGISSLKSENERLAETPL